MNGGRPEMGYDYGITWVGLQWVLSRFRYWIKWNILVCRRVFSNNLERIIYRSFIALQIYIIFVYRKFSWQYFLLLAIR